MKSTYKACVIALSVFAATNVLAHGSSRCDSLQKLPYGIYSGSITFANGNIEAITFNLGKDGSISLISRLEFPSSGIPGLSDLETPFVGQWQSNCDGKSFKFAAVSRRQAGAGGGIPALFGYTVSDIPSLPNYVLVTAGDLTISKSGLLKTTSFILALGDSGYGSPGNISALLPFTTLLPIVKVEAQRQSVDTIYNAIPK